jgi:nucleoside-diphosphate-sugar epimerase
MKVLLTGASGFIGKSLLPGLSENHDVLAPPHSELELLDAGAVRKYLRENSVDAIIHGANRGGTRASAPSSSELGDNLRMFFNIAMNSGEVSRILYFGSGAEYGKHRDLLKVKESSFGEEMPRDDYGFYKYVCNRHAEKSSNIINLRLFGVFGMHEEYEYRFISNAIVKNLLGCPITINQDVEFDYLYAPDLLPVVEHFISSPHKSNSYNVTPDEPISLTSISGIINELSPNKSEIRVLNPGMNYAYSGDNSRIRAEIPGLEFTSYRDSIGELFKYYSAHIGEIDRERILSDPYLSKCKARK